MQEIQTVQSSVIRAVLWDLKFTVVLIHVPVIDLIVLLAHQEGHVFQLSPMFSLMGDTAHLRVNPEKISS